MVSHLLATPSYSPATMALEPLKSCPLRVLSFEPQLAATCYYSITFSSASHWHWQVTISSKRAVPRCGC